MYKGKKVGIIIPAAGKGSRMGSNVPKQFMKINGQSIIEKTIEVFVKMAVVDYIVIVVEKNQINICKDIVCNIDSKSEIKIVAGGKERQDSVYKGLKVCPTEIVLVHDGARAFIKQDIVLRVLEEAERTGAAVCAVPVKDTIRNMEGTLDRKKLVSVQTPQGFDKKLLMKAYKKAFEDNFHGTDEGSIVEREGTKVSIIRGDYENIKITTKEDLPLENRVGIGYDVHALVLDRKLILGGVEIPYDKGLKGHSDADVLIHAVMDAILGAAAMGDIGKHFPDIDVAYRGISSIVLLKKVNELIKKEGFAIGNIDVTLIAQKPKIARYIEEMKSNISAAINIDVGQINIKGTTTEGLGFAGRGEGIAAQAICILNR